MRHLGASAILAIAVTACSGSTASHVTPSAPATNAKSGGTTTIALSISIPGSTLAAQRRLPQYVSSASQSVSVLVNGTTQSDGSLTGSNCTATSGARTCTIAVVAPVGSDTFAVTIYQGPCTGGPPCTHSGAALSAASSFMQTITEGQANLAVPLVLGGIVNSATINVGPDPGGTTHNVPVYVTATDASGATIIGPAAYVNASGAPAPIQLRAQLEPGVNALGPMFVLNGNVQSPANLVTVSAPTDVVAMLVNSSAQNVLGATIFVASGVPGSPPTGFYKAYGTTTSIPAAVTYANGAIAGSVSAFAPAAPLESLPNSVYAGTNAGWIFNLSTSSNWTTPATNTYCKIAAATSIEGIGTDTSGNAYVSYFDGTHSYFAMVARGSSNAVTPCESLAGYKGPVQFAASGNLGGIVATNSSVVFFVNHLTSPMPTSDEEVDVEPLGLAGITVPNYIYINPGATNNGLAGAAIDPTDGSLWVVANYTNRVFHVVGSASYTSYALANSGGYGLTTNCNPNGIAADGAKLYISCSGAGVTDVLTPNGTNAPTITSIATISGNGSIALPQDIAIGPDGYLWILSGSTVIKKFDRTLGGTALASLSGGLGYLNAVVAGGDGDLWLGEGTGTAEVHRLGAGVGP